MIAEVQNPRNVFSLLFIIITMYKNNNQHTVKNKNKQHGQNKQTITTYKHNLWNLSS